MYRSEFATFNKALLTFLNAETGVPWDIERFDYDWTYEFHATLASGKFVVIQTHAWSWDGSHDPKLISTWLDETPGNMILHLSSPIRPDQEETEQ